MKLRDFILSASLSLTACGGPIETIQPTTEPTKELLECQENIRYMQEMTRTRLENIPRQQYRRFNNYNRNLLETEPEDISNQRDCGAMEAIIYRELILDFETTLNR